MAQDPADAEEYLIPILDAIDKWQKTTQELLEEAKKRVKRVRDYIVIDMENVELIQKMVDENLNNLLRKHELTHGTLENIPKPEFYK